MGTSFVEMNGKGFWMRDGVLCMWLRLVALHIRCGANGDDPLTRLRNEWMFQSEAQLNGMVEANLDLVSGDINATEQLSAAIRALMENLGAVGPQIDAATLNLLGAGNWSVPAETAGLIEIGNAFLDLLNGKITSEADSTEFMPGCRR